VFGYCQSIEDHPRLRGILMLSSNEMGQLNINTLCFFTTVPLVYATIIFPNRPFISSLTALVHGGPGVIPALVQEFNKKSSHSNSSRTLCRFPMQLTVSRASSKQ
jgi:hypothetical protein